MTAQRHRPIGITFLAILCFIAGIVSVYHGLQFLGLIPSSLGPVNFFNVNILGALVYGILAWIWFWVGYALWKVYRQGWWAVIIISILNLILVGLAIIGQSTFQSLLPALLISVIVLIYALTPGVKRAFGSSPSA